MGAGIKGAYASGSTTIDVGAFVAAVPGDAELLLSFVVNRKFTLPVALAGSEAYAETAAAASATIDIQKNTSSVGSINIALGANVATFTFATAVEFAIGDRLQLVNQGTADATLADIGVTLRGNL